MSVKIKFSIFRSPALKLCCQRFSSAASGVKVSEQKVRVGRSEINYVNSSIEGRNPQKTLLLLPGALGENTELIKVKFMPNIQAFRIGVH